MAYPSVTYTFTNGTVASGPNVSTNFSDLVAALSDGSKDISVNALTAAGTATFNGAVTLGNATGDDITVTGYVASALIPKTDDTYDLGTAALAWQDAYFDGAVYTDTISELGSAAGVTIDGVLLKDSGAKFNNAIGLGGNTPTATWTSLWDVIESGRGHGFAVYNDNNAQLYANMYYDGAYKYKVAAAACQLIAGEGELYFNTAGSGSANDPISWAAKLIIQNSGSIFAQGVYDNTFASAANVVVYSNGNLLRATSSEKYKKEIRPYDKGIETVNKLVPVYFKSKNDDYPQQHAGLIAERLHELGLEEFVEYGAEDQPEGIFYTHMIALMTKAIQELSAKVTALEERLSA
jgi:hypothetical protein